MLFSGKIRFHDVARLTARGVLFATICYDLPLLATTGHYSPFPFSRHPRIVIVNGSLLKFRKNKEEILATKAEQEK